MEELFGGLSNISATIWGLVVIGSAVCASLSVYLKVTQDLCKLKDRMEENLSRESERFDSLRQDFSWQNSLTL